MTVIYSILGIFIGSEAIDKHLKYNDTYISVIPEVWHKGFSEQYCHLEDKKKLSILEGKILFFPLEEYCLYPEKNI
jgi:hypothetical protein